jgi:aspartate/methionine/tyrosine aminotransferase
MGTDPGPRAPRPAEGPTDARPNLGLGALGGAFRPVPRTGVIFVTEEANARGYRTGHPEWSNLGQGQPESGELPGAPPRLATIGIDPRDHEYAPVAGIADLRAAVADFYNRTYRRGLRSQYTAENVAISGGGRSGLTRVAAALGQINLGHFLPDYTAYEELLDIFRAFLPTSILLDPEQAFRFDARDLRREILGRGLSALLLSNPSNPTGRLVWGDELAAWVGCARELACALVIDEFYSHYVWAEGAPVMESAARYVEDVDRDPVILIDGLTKNWRYPGWRVSWTVGPRRVIEAVTSAGSFLDGGGSRPLQRAAIPLLESAVVEQEVAAIRAAFAPKRERMLARVRALGMQVELEPQGTFYVFASLAQLPEPLADCMHFFGAALAQKLICVPGVFFDVNPGQRRGQRLARFRHHVRLSFGPPMEEVERGLDRLERVVAAVR